MKHEALISPCEKYRYVLRRTWDSQRKTLLVCMLNPSTANAIIDDPTVTRLIVRATDAGYGGICVVNLFAYRTAYPKILLQAFRNMVDVVGPRNTQVIREHAAECSECLIAWGNHKVALHRERPVLEILRKHCVLLTLGLTKDGFPKHPLHIAYGVPMTLYKGRFA